MFGIDDDAVVHDTQTRTAVGPGIEITRRSMIRVSMATLLAIPTLGACSSTKTGPSTKALESEEVNQGVLEIGELLDELLPQSRQLVASGGKNEDRYLANVASLMQRLNAPSRDDVRQAMMDFRDKHGATGPKSLGIALVVYGLEDGRGFDHHDHRNYNGVIMGLEGEVRCRNFEIVGDELVPPKGQTFQIRQTRDHIVRPGEFSSLGIRTDNIHEVIAGSGGAKVLDAFTFFESDARSYSMTVDEKPRDAARGIFDAAWA